MRVLATYNIKGGVGKTATAVNLAYLSAREGARTLVWDLDPQGAATFYFRVKPKMKGGWKRLVRGRSDIRRSIRGTDFGALDLVPSDFSSRNLDLYLDRSKRPSKRLARLLKPLGKAYDFVILDCPPSISLVSESIFGAADVLLVPTLPTTLSIRAHEQLRNHLSDMGRNRPALFPFLCLVDLRRSLHREICKRFRDEDRNVLEAWIPYSSTVERMGVHRAPLGTFAGKSPPALAYERLWNEIRARLSTGEAAAGRES
jgi:cellulose biosynthesis protein BcsQ